MTTTPSQPAAPAANPRIILEAGQQYEPGDINFLTPEVLAKFSSPDEGIERRFDSLHSVTPATAASRLIYGLLWKGDGVIGYPIKPGTYPTVVNMIYVRPPSEDDAHETLVKHESTTVDLVVTGQPLGTWYDREVLHFLSPRVATVLANLDTLKDGMDGLMTRVWRLENPPSEQ